MGHVLLLSIVMSAGIYAVLLEVIANFPYSQYRAKAIQFSHTLLLLLLLPGFTVSSTEGSFVCVRVGVWVWVCVCVVCNNYWCGH